jgi:hypothetical protein
MRRTCYRRSVSWPPSMEKRQGGPRLGHDNLFSAALPARPFWTKAVTTGHCHIDRFYWSLLTSCQESVSIKSMC